MARAASRTPERALEPVRCWLRHVRRTRAGEVGTTVGPVAFIRTPAEALGGAQGWQSGQASAALSDTGELTVTLPNTAGEDGILHRRRFAYFTDDAYRPGEEWLELYREPHEVLAVCTPYKGRKARTTLELVGWDVAGQLNRYRGSELDVWADGWAPRDVWEHYTRLPGIAIGTDFAGFAATFPWNGWSAPAGGVTVSPSGGPRIGNAAGWKYLDLPAALMPTDPADCFAIEWRFRIVATSEAGGIAQLNVPGGIIVSLAVDGTVTVYGSQNTGAQFAGGPAGANITAKRQGFQAIGAHSIRLVVRYERVFVLIDGELVAQYRRQSAPAFTAAGIGVSLYSYNTTTMDVEAFHLETLRPFALRGADKGDLRLPGIPPAGGLRARYWNTAGLNANQASFPARLARLAELDVEPDVDRLEPMIDMTKGTTVPNMAGSYFTRWTGAIYLDLATADRRLRLGEAHGYARVFVGRTRRLVDELLNRWPAIAGYSDAWSGNVMRASSAGAEVDLAGWGTTSWWLNAGATLARTAAPGEVIAGAYSAKVTTTAASAYQGVFITPDPAWLTSFLAGTRYRATVYLRGAVGGEQVNVGLGGSGDAAGGPGATLPGPGQDPLAVSVDWTPTAARDVAGYGITVRTLAPLAQSWFVDRVRIVTVPPETPNLRATLGSKAGWFPIVVEAFKSDNLGGWLLEDAAVDAGGTVLDAATGWQIVGPGRLSPIGVYEENLRHEAHRGVIDTLAQTFGYQWRTEPRTLETNEFPGQIPPRIRVGVDTDKVIDDLGGVDVTVDSDASDAIDSLIADAAGIADPNGSGQLSAQVIDYDAAKAHLGMAADYESLSEMSEPSGLETRLGSLLALRSSPNEQVGVRPSSGARELVDTFPLTGALARLRWLPGDGVRLALDDVDVIDRTPRQLTRVELAVAPDAIAPPTVGFRQRPRSPAAVLKRTLKAVYALGRNYQGTMSLLSGTPGGTTAAGAAAGAPDTYSRLPLPINLDDLDRVWLNVHYSANVTNAGTIEVAGVSTGIVVAGPGLYDVTAWVRRIAAEGSFSGRTHSRIISPTAQSEYVLIARLRI
jgi:hypothetical protein